ncbi:MAG: hypothetical protein ACT4N2_07380 [Hyphomicrobium sp.]
MPRTIKIGSKSFTLPDYAPARIAIGVLLVIGGFLGFLPLLGFWMIPLGIVILSYDIPRVRLFRQRVMAWWRNRNGEAKPGPDA